MQILPIAYFPPVSYFSLIRQGGVFLEACENYQKQSYRNRCQILTANGVESLQVPVVHYDGSFRHPIRETFVDYSTPWLQKHKRAIDSAYMSSAYFEYYRDDLYAILDARIESLFDLDLALTRFFISALRLPDVGTTDAFVGVTADIHPKRNNAFYVEKPYYQVFSNKFPFAPDLSIMDLVFNEGPESELYL